MKPRIGDIWLDSEGEHSVVIGFEKWGDGTESSRRTKVNLYVLDSSYVRDGEEDFTHVEINNFGPDKYMHTLVSRIDNAKEED